MKYTEEQISKIKDKIYSIDEEQIYNDMLNDCYPMVNICGYEYEPAQALKDVDEIAYNTGKNDYFGTSDEYEEVDGLLYLSSEIETLIEEMEENKDNENTI